MTQALVLLAIAAACSGADDGDPAASLVEIRASGCRLTPTRAVGVVVGDDLVATVAHPVAGESEILVRAGGRELPAEIAAIDTSLDAAVLRVDGLDRPPLERGTFAGESAAVTLWTADDGAVQSAPAEVLRRVTVRTGDIYRDGQRLRPGLELAAEIEAGDSGGGLVDTDGELVGLVWATSRAHEGRAWGLPIEAFDPLLAAAEAREPVPPARCAR